MGRFHSTVSRNRKSLARRRRSFPKIGGGVGGALSSTRQRREKEKKRRRKKKNMKRTTLSRVGNNWSFKLVTRVEVRRILNRERLEFDLIFVGVNTSVFH